MKNKFVKIPNQWYQIKNNNSFMATLGGKRFTLWFGINKVAAEMNMSGTVQLQIKQLVNELKDLKGFSNPARVKDMLMALRKAKLIECSTLNERTKSTDLLNVKVNTKRYKDECEELGFSMISTELYDDKIRELDCTGFFIYCFLHKHHRIENGNQDITNHGYAEASREFIGEMLGIRSVKTVTKYTNKIVKAKHLVKKVKQEKYYYENEFGETEQAWTSNRYIVRPKIDSENKYYIPTTNNK